MVRAALVTRMMIRLRCAGWKGEIDRCVARVARLISVSQCAKGAYLSSSQDQRGRGRRGRSTSVETGRPRTREGEQHCKSRCERNACIAKLAHPLLPRLRCWPSVTRALEKPLWLAAEMKRGGVVPRPKFRRAAATLIIIRGVFKDVPRGR
jgi:hypothetical protein